MACVAGNGGVRSPSDNGLNLLHVEYYSQKIVIGVVLIAAAYLDRFRQESG